MPQGSKKLTPIEAVRVVFDTLEPLDVDERERVLSSVLALIGSVPAKLSRVLPPEGNQLGEQTAQQRAAAAAAPVLDIKTLREQKKPRSNLEMAVVVAYYLAEVARHEERKGSITASDIDKYFKQAQYPMPQNKLMTLVNAKNAGYLETAGGGKYKLSPVGYNLVAHGLPRPASESAGGTGRNRSAGKRKASDLPSASRSKRKKRG